MPIDFGRDFDDVTAVLHTVYGSKSMLPKRRRRFVLYSKCSIATAITISRSDRVKGYPRRFYARSTLLIYTDSVVFSAMCKERKKFRVLLAAAILLEKYGGFGRCGGSGTDFGAY